MPRYYFDTRDDDYFLRDEEGVELADVAIARAEAARTLAEIARDVLPGSERREIAVDVRDGTEQPLFRAVLLFGIEGLA